MKEEIYVSIDVEADGPIPGDNSMLSLGAAAYRKDKTLLDTFSVNLLPLVGARQNQETMAWWFSTERNKEAYYKTREDMIAPKRAMKSFSYWVQGLPGKTVAVAYPAGFDFMFVYWYLMYFTGHSPFGFSCIDMKSYAAALLGTPFRKTHKRSMPKEWFDDLPHTHVAVDDAVEQGALFCNMLSYKK